MGDIFSYIVTIVGLLGFWLAGRKVWWAWYINILNQFAWVAFALITEYYAFLIGTAFYLFVFVRNAYLWTKEHRENRSPPKPLKPLPVIGEMLEIQHDDRGISATFKLNDEGRRMMYEGKLKGLLISPIQPGQTITAIKE